MVITNTSTVGEVHLFYVYVALKCGGRIRTNYRTLVGMRKDGQKYILLMK
jgi:hypothetical protein